MTNERENRLRVVGTTPIRPDGLEKVTGRATFADDIHLPRMLHGKVLRSPHAHAVIKAIDTRKAAALPGVHAVVTGADFPEPATTIKSSGEGGIVDMAELADNCIAKTKALYDGHAIAAVAGS
jgi:CO/xanthine dehydrogenase Mo-binding subunit